MSNFIQDFEGDDQFRSTVEHGADGSTPTTTISKKKRSLPGNPDPDAEVVALSPRTLMATNRYICEVCHEGFQRDQNLQLHRRGHNLPWKLKQRTIKAVKKRVYVCPEPNCVHHEPSRALGDLTGIKKHFCRKHGEKKWKCDKCAKRYAVQSDWKAHTKICGTREYRCDCGTIFSRKDSFVSHTAFCDALTEVNNHNLTATQRQAQEMCPDGVLMSSNFDQILYPSTLAIGSAYTSATALLQKAAEIGAKMSDNTITPILLRGFTGYSTSIINSSGCVEEGSSMVETGDGDPRSHHNHNHNLASNSQVYLEGGEKLTVDFLGVEPGKKRSYGGNIMNLQQSFRNLPSNR